MTDLSQPPRATTNLEPVSATSGTDPELACAATLADHERQPCEVWTRVMGYHRPVASFNVGKKGEHAQRRFFLESAAARHA